MRLTIRTNLALRALMYCGVHNGRLVRTQEIALACNASANHLAQVIHTLGLREFVRTERGRRGGLALARPMHSIGLGEVLRVFETEVPFAECFSADNACPLTPACRLRPAIAAAVEAFYAAFDGLTLADLVEGNDGLAKILAPDSARTARNLPVCSAPS
jgi:Rrf2 family transcriptional regulator, nitric oxide-sensitive transcriptional repressor